MPDVTFVRQPDGLLRAELRVDGQSVTRQFQKPYVLSIGAARVRAEGIGRVATEAAFRKRGHYRRLIEASHADMARRGVALSVLYGVPWLYPRFGYATAGPEHCLHLVRLNEPERPLPAGWRIRDFTPDDLPRLRAIYAECTARSVGAVAPDVRQWDNLLGCVEAGSRDACRVALSPEGEVRGYAWLSIGPWGWAVRHLERRYPGAMVVAEALAIGADAADALLAMCRAWGIERSAGREAPYQQVIVGTEPGGALIDAAQHHSASFCRHYSACGDSMARVIDVVALLGSLAPELTQRALACRDLRPGALRVTTDIGSVDLVLGEDGVSTSPASESPPAWHLRVPQGELARLCLGAFAPEHIFSRLPRPPDDDTARVASALFPLRQPHMHMPDRF